MVNFLSLGGGGGIFKCVHEGVYFIFIQMDTIAAIFIHQLTEARHRGAFEMAHTGFSKLCRALWSSPIPDMSKKPRAWVGDLLDSLQSSSVAKLLTVTRRSAGLPFFVQVRFLLYVCGHQSHIRIVIA